MMVLRTSLQVGMLACFAVAALAQQEAGNCGAENGARRPDCPQAIAFFRQMQSAIKLGEPDKVALMINFPLHTTLNGNRTQIRSKQQLQRPSRLLSVLRGFDPWAMSK